MFLHSLSSFLDKALHLWIQMQNNELTVNRHEWKPYGFMIRKLRFHEWNCPVFMHRKVQFISEVPFTAQAQSCPQGQFIA